MFHSPQENTPSKGAIFPYNFWDGRFSDTETELLDLRTV